MYIIKKTNSPKPIKINISSWEGFAQSPETVAFLTLTETGFCATFRVSECNPKRVNSSNFSPVHLDSCVEWFVNFAPEICNSYFNFEVNACGAMNVSFRRDRYDSTPLTTEDVDLFNITTGIFKDFWEVSYEIPFSFIKKYIPGYEIKNGDVIKTNLYKCGDETVSPHYLSHFRIDCPNPDFHRPEFFGEMMVEL